MRHPVLLDGHTLTLEALATARDGAVRWTAACGLTIPAEAHSHVCVRRVKALESLDLGATAYYGINTGFGKLCDVRIAEDAVECLQGNLVRSHAVGVGAPVPDEIVRLMLALKIQSLVRGHSAVQPVVVERLLDFLNHDILPVRSLRKGASAHRVTSRRWRTSRCRCWARASCASAASRCRRSTRWRSSA
jgi:histidine ammonia-lyase